MKIAITGVQGTGKTTLINELTEYFSGYTIIKELVRDFKKQGHEINKLATEQTQELILHRHLQNNQKYKNYITDRGSIDAISYAAWSHNDGQFSTKDFVNFLEIFFNIKYDLVVYVPIEFNPPEDGVRDTDEEYRKALDDWMRFFLHKGTAIHTVEVKGNLQERVQQVLKTINALQNEKI